MLHTPIKKPKLVGCLNCSPLPRPVLSRRHRWHVYGIISLAIDGRSVDTWIDESPTIQRIEKLYGEQIAASKCALLKVSTPLHGEVYERNPDDGKWYLVEQNLGWE